MASLKLKLCQLVLILMALHRSGEARLKLYEGRIVFVEAGDDTIGVQSWEVEGVASVEIGSADTSPVFFFDCNTTANDGAKIVWARQVAPIDPAQTSIDNGKRVELGSPDPEDLGIYVCVDQATGEQVSLNITSSNPAVCAVLNTKAIVLGQSVGLKVYVSGIPPIISSWISWFGPDGNELTEANATFQDNKRMLILNNIQNSSAGTYKCLVVIPVAPLLFLFRHSSDTIELKIYLPSVITQDPQNHIGIEEWSEVILSCTATGHPLPVISWEREGGELPVFSQISSSDSDGMVVSMLTIGTVHYMDMGRYRCSADNTETAVVHSQYAELSVIQHNECDTDNGGCNQTCTNTIGSFFCSCDLGYELNKDGLGCSDIDECDRDLDNCDIIAACTNTVGSYDCTCIAGFEGPGFIQNCSNIDECARGTDNCGVYADCTDIPGDFFCTCLEGFKGNGIICADIDECLEDSHNCHPNATCSNMIGGFNCTCNLGYIGNGVICEDIDECARGTDNCGVYADCTDIPGDFFCTCLEGFKGNGIICADIDECLEDFHNCHPNATCSNMIGGFNCTCNLGYIGNGVICEEINAPPLAKSNGYLVTAISASVLGVLVILSIILMVAVVRVMIVRRRKKLTHDNQHFYESVSVHALNLKYNITVNDAYVPGTSASNGQQNLANTEKLSSRASHSSHEAVEGEEMGDSEDQNGSVHEHERDASVWYQAGDDYEQAQCYELAGGAHEQAKSQDYEQTSDPYERVQDYEQQQASGPYDQFRGQDYEQTSDPYDRVQDYERQQASGAYDQFKGQDYEQTSDPYDRVQDYEQQQASGAYDQIQRYERLQVIEQQNRVEDNGQQQASGAYDQV